MGESPIRLSTMETSLSSFRYLQAVKIFQKNRWFKTENAIISLNPIPHSVLTLHLSLKIKPNAPALGETLYGATKRFKKFWALLALSLLNKRSCFLRRMRKNMWRNGKKAANFPETRSDDSHRRHILKTAGLQCKMESPKVEATSLVLQSFLTPNSGEAIKLFIWASEGWDLKGSLTRERCFRRCSLPLEEKLVFHFCQMPECSISC